MRLSKNFDTAEFVCHHCGQIDVQRGLPVLVAGLEDLRALGYRQGLHVVSGYRCRLRQEQLHAADPKTAAKDSQHCYCSAADVDLRVALADVVALGRFSGIGWQWVGPLGRRRKLVRHVDVRHVSGFNPKASTVCRPAVWQYAA